MAGTSAGMWTLSKHSCAKAAFLLVLLYAVHGQSSPNCTERRCLAEKLILNPRLTQPQSHNCTQLIFVPFIEYQTLSVDTKKLRFHCQLRAVTAWMDPDLTWDTSIYPFDRVVLPVSEVWYPEIHVTNAVRTSMRHASRDLLVHSDGTVEHNIIINAEVDCEVNLLKYPFAADDCPVAIQAWGDREDHRYDTGCGLRLVIDAVKMADGNHGDWRTDKVTLTQKSDGRDYILVSLSIRYLNPFISLMLPSIMIIVVDVASFALPLGGGERNSFKVTLVLSFIMFLVILNDLLPGDGQCSPIIRRHFCVCLTLLVLSMLVSMILTRVAKDGAFLSCSRFKKSSPENAEDKEDPGDEGTGDEEATADIGVSKPRAPEEMNRHLKRVLSFLEALDARYQEAKSCQDLANRVDKICFCIYLCICATYFCAE
ncbi:5-hydroxytryptamine receptor 3A-like [Lampris incognitus]|uniref:5-hydroxytryptamine receptor 3A-like n=1 Tax=Lampris incognitus TaxID=2546036 RepID=UPI0024B5D6E3|nr:5-hydroxytryptamine receptor 3A-like [Lampris incognitus]